MKTKKVLLEIEVPVGDFCLGCCYIEENVEDESYCSLMQDEWYDKLDQDEHSNPLKLEKCKKLQTL